MRSVRRVALGVALLGLAGSVNAAAQCLEDLKAPAAGSWSEYKTNDGTMRLALLGNETRAGKTYVRMEMSVTSKDGPMVMQMLVPGYPYDISGIAEMVMQPAGQPAMRMPQQMLSMMASRMPKDLLAEACSNRNITRVGEESITVPAGTFRTIHFHDSQNNNDVWVSSSIPFGLVQTKTARDNIVLVATGGDAQSKITGPIQDMPM